MTVGAWRTRTRVAVGLVVLAGASSLVAAPHAFRSTLARASKDAALTRQGRELAPARRVGVAGAALVGAARVIPPSATYYVASSPELTETVRPMTFYWLFPRRYVDAPADADWIVAYGRDPRALGVPVGRVVRLAPHVLAAEVRR